MRYRLFCFDYDKFMVLVIHDRHFKAESIATFLKKKNFNFPNVSKINATKKQRKPTLCFSKLQERI